MITVKIMIRGVYFYQYLKEEYIVVTIFTASLKLFINRWESKTLKQ